MLLVVRGKFFRNLLEVFLQQVNINIEDELLIGLKAIYNSEFHKGEEQSVKVARQESFFNTFDIWDGLKIFS